MTAERSRVEADFERPPDRAMRLVGHAIVDPATGDENHAIDWSFQLGDRAKIRIVNEPDNLPHPIHFHGQRFLVLARGGQRQDNLCWKDTVLVQPGETVDVLLECTNPGSWMSHCHIAEHLEAHMMFTYQVLASREEPPTSGHQHGGHR
jgi:FtsP/CotA-like multicopper oxidase with cupredoxin domain